MKTKIAAVILCSLVFFAALRPATAAETNGTVVQTQNGSFYDFVLQQQRDIGEKLKSGDTNTPLLILEWFMTDHYVQSCRVSRDGIAALSDYGREMGSGRGSHQIDSAQQKMLVKVMDKLPQPPSSTPKDRWLLISGLRGNEWFTQIYDRADIPPEVERLFEIVGARLQWIVGDTDTTTNIAGRYADTWVTSLQTASKAPIAVSSSAVASGMESDSIQLWDIKNWKEVMVPAVEEFTTWPWSAAVLSSDGESVALGARGLRLVDLNTGKIRWDSKSHGDTRLVKKLAFIQNDKLLAVAFLNSVEIWDSLTGQKLDTLVTNEPVIDLMESSRDGKLLAFASGKKKIQVWDLEKREIIRETIDDPNYIEAIKFSPDTKYLAISGAPYRGSFVLWDLKTGNKTIIPARGSQYPEEVKSLAWSPNGNFFAAASQGQELLIYDVQTWKPLTRWRGVGDDFIAFADDDTLLARLKDGSLRALNVSSIKSLIKP